MSRCVWDFESDHNGGGIGFLCSPTWSALSEVTLSFTLVSRSLRAWTHARSHTHTHTQDATLCYFLHARTNKWHSSPRHLQTNHLFFSYWPCKVSTAGAWIWFKCVALRRVPFIAYMHFNQLISTVWLCSGKLNILDSGTLLKVERKTV